MSLVIGLKTNNALVVASDGLALYDDKEKNETIKKYTYSKIRTVQPGNILLGYVGSTGIYAETVSPLLKEAEQLKKDDTAVIHRKEEYLAETDFIESLASQVKGINKKLEKEMMKMFVGYCSNPGKYQLIYFDQDGTAEEIDDFVALGSGAIRIMNELESIYTPDWSIKEAVSALIDMIYIGSEVPTVNFLPMVACLQGNKLKNYSSYTIKELDNFKKRIKKGILQSLKKDYSKSK